MHAFVKDFKQAKSPSSIDSCVIVRMAKKTSYTICKYVLPKRQIIKAWTYSSVEILMKNKPVLWCLDSLILACLPFLQFWGQFKVHLCFSGVTILQSFPLLYFGGQFSVHSLGIQTHFLQVHLSSVELLSWYSFTCSSQQEVSPQSGSLRCQVFNKVSMMSANSCEVCLQSSKLKDSETMQEL